MTKLLAVAVLFSAGGLAFSAAASAQGYSPRCMKAVTDLCGDTPAGTCFSSDAMWAQVPDLCIGDIQTMIEAEREAGEQDGPDTSGLNSQDVKDMEGNLYGYSYGGRLRSGPDAQSAPLASLREGEPIRILENTGIWFDGYVWYRVLTRHGEGYHWGGIFCANIGEALEGVLARCNGPRLEHALIDSRESGGAAVDAAIILRGDGVVLRSGEHLAFGAPEARAIEQLAFAIGTAPAPRSRAEDCGPGALDVVGWDSGFVAYLQDGQFVGWTAIDERTAEGIGFGSSRADLNAAFGDFEIQDSSLGTEFFVQGISGVLESQLPDAQVNSIWAGMTCVMR